MSACGEQDVRPSAALGRGKGGTVYQRLGKRLLDVACSAVALVALWPLFLLMTLAISLRLGRPVLFSQIRPGWFARPFTLLKFRTMKEVRDASGAPLPDEERITRLGTFIRSTSLDELPELFNVLRGDMSLVGPRPLLMEYLDRYSPEQMRRHDARPGITGLAQVSGRNAITWEEKLKLDVQYVRNVNLVLDLKILAMTFKTVVRSEGINQPGVATAAKFLGSSPTIVGDEAGVCGARL